MGMARLTSQQRRQVVLEAAVAEFSRGGLEGTSTEAIARRAGISQPYLFRLYPSKKALFVATVEAAFERIIDTFEQAAKGRDDDAVLEAMGQAYTELLEDRNLLLIQLHAYAACSDPDIRAVTRRAFRRMWAAITGLAGISGEELTRFVAVGMLLNVAAAMDLDEVDQEWAQLCSKVPPSWLDSPAQPPAAPPAQPPAPAS
jgi:AcrR family transcriptional regulator